MRSFPRWKKIKSFTCLITLRWDAKCILINYVLEKECLRYDKREKDSRKNFHFIVSGQKGAKMNNFPFLFVIMTSTWEKFNAEEEEAEGKKKFICIHFAPDDNMLWIRKRFLILLRNEMSARWNKSLVKLNICDCERVRCLVRAFFGVTSNGELYLGTRCNVSIVSLSVHKSLRN